jgi:hypothetical protein
MVEDQEEHNEDGLIKELTPTLHEESHRHLTASMKTIVSC